MNCTFPLKRMPALLLTIAVACIMGSCSPIRVIKSDGASADCAGSGQRFCHDTTIVTSLWKSKNKVDIASQCTNGISRFKVTTKPGDVILGFLTAGFVVKQHIDWDCSQRSGSSDID
jgi:hypothetical protein